MTGLKEISEFDQTVALPEYQAIAELANNYYDQARFSGKAAVEAGISLAEEEPLPDMPPKPFALIVGQKIARDAWRWWDYRKAYLTDIEPIYKNHDRDQYPWRFGLEPYFKSYAEKLETSQQEQDKAKKALSKCKRVYFAL